MPSFDPQLPISNSVYGSSSITFDIHVFNLTFHSLFHPSSCISVRASTIHPYRATDFGVFLEDDAIDLSPGTVFISAKERTQAFPSDLLNSGAFDKKQSSTSVNIKSSAVQVESQRLPLEEVQQLNRFYTKC
uniref:Uncharacterized protein n=1 Tax=Salix viminalis TaxID=40686 RepID=A0A6N2MI62_SALVM